MEENPSADQTVGLEIIFSDSDDNEDDLLGVEINDLQRGLFSEAKKVPLYTSTPAKGFKQHHDFSDSQEVDGDFGGEIFIETEGVDKVRDGNCEPETNNVDKDEIETDSDIEGELVGSIFCSSSKKLKEECSSNVTVIEDPDSEIEGEIFSDECFSNLEEEETDAPQENVQPTKKRGKHRSTVLKPEDLLLSKCCSENCFTKLQLSQIKKARSNFYDECPTYESQRKKILDWLDSNQPQDGVFCYSVSGIPVCWLAWIGTYGITKRRFQYLKNDYQNGRKSAIHGSFANISYSDKTDAIIRYLEKYFKENCDYMPNSDSWHLPSAIKKSEVFQEMCIVFQSEGLSPCSEASFRKVWNTHFPHVKIPKENRFGKCDHCSTIKEELRATVGRIAEREAVKEMKAKHLVFVRKERTSYLERAAKSHQQPNKFFSIAIDGMDQNKTEIPFTVWRHGTLEKSWRLKLHVVGAVIHGRNPIMFLDYQQHSHDSNMTSNILLQSLWVHRDLLPGTIYIQLDNTCKENKNQFVFQFLAYLVETKVFDKIEVSFLPVGHTHIDVDQMFSRLSVAISRRGAKTYQDLLRNVRTCHNQTQGEINQEGAMPQYARIDHVYAIREWLQPHCEPLHRLRDMHHFSFVLDDIDEKGDIRCVIDYKPWCSATSWDRETWKPIGPVIKEVPAGIPDLIIPNFQAVGLDRIEKTIEKCTEKGILNSREEEVWQEFFAEEKKYVDVYKDVEAINYGDDNIHKPELQYIPCSDSRWLLDDIRERTRPNEGDTPNLKEALKTSEAYERGEGFLPIYMGPYRPPKEKQKEVLEDQDIKDLEEGMLVALDMEKYRERPLIGEVREIKADSVTVAWYGGSWTTKWSPARKKEGRKFVDWLEEVEKSSVVLFDFSFTKGGKLRLHTSRHLKEVYGM